jgi:hypothetical protein
MLAAVALTSLVALASGAGEAPWEEKAKSDGVTVYARSRPGSDVRELKSMGLIDAPPQAVLKVLSDYPRYKEIMPYTDESEVVSTEEGGKVVHFYTLINAPLVSRRDYTLRITEESDWKDGKGFLKTRWTASDKGPAAKDGVVRIKTNDGSWVLEPREGGKKTFATYFIFTDPGGALPTFLVNKANSSAIPDVFEALRKHAKDARYAK